MIGGLEGWQVIFSGRISIWWTVLGDWGAGGVTGDLFWSAIDLVDCGLLPRFNSGPKLLANNRIQFQLCFAYRS